MQYLPRFMSKEKYFKDLGFKEDPFGSTNAMKERYLESYFIDPPYFSSLVGSLTNPRTTIVIAPRGTGKTAQRRMLEKISEDVDNLVCIVYDNFPLEDEKSVEDITLDKHLIQIIEHLVIALITELYSTDKQINLNRIEKQSILQLVEIYLDELNDADVQKSIESIKGLSHKFKELWDTTSESLGSIVNGILTSYGISEFKLPKFNNGNKNTEEYRNIDRMSHLEIIEKLFNKLGIDSIFILLDRVDETSLTGNDSKKTYELIKPLIKDLRLLEKDTIVFKFFLWDKLKEHWIDDIRTDRIEIFNITWNDTQIRELVDRRISSLSDNKYTQLSDILDSNEEIIDMIYLYSNNSPRDILNLLATIFDEHFNKHSNSSISIDNKTYPNSTTIIDSIEKFSKKKFEELVSKEKQRKELQRIKTCTFTISYLSNEVFKCNASTARNKLMPWTRGGFVVTSPNQIKLKPKSNPVNVYTFNDIRIARHICSDQTFEEFMDRNVYICKDCGTVNLFDIQNIYNIKSWQCKNCSEQLL